MADAFKRMLDNMSDKDFLDALRKSLPREKKPSKEFLEKYEDYQDRRKNEPR